MENLLSEILNNLSIIDLEYILNHNNLKKAGNKQEKILRLLEFDKKSEEDFQSLIYSFDIEIIDKTFNFLKIENNEKNDYFTKRKNLISYLQNNGKIGKKNYLESISKDLRELFETEKQNLSKNIFLTYNTYLSLDIFKLESVISDLKHDNKINRYLDHRFHSDSIAQSIIYFKKNGISNTNSFKKHYELPLLFYFYKLSKSEHYKKSKIDNITEFFLDAKVRERLSFEDIKIHKTGGTRCISYAQNSLKKLEEDSLIDQTSTSLSITLYGILLTSNYLLKNNINYNLLFDKILTIDFCLDNLIEAKKTIHQQYKYLNEFQRNILISYIERFLKIICDNPQVNIFYKNSFNKSDLNKIGSKLQYLQKEVENEIEYKEVYGLIVKELKLNKLVFDNPNDEN